MTLALSQVLFATLFGITILGDSPSLLGLLGSVLIAGGVILANMAKSTPKSTSSDTLPVKASAFAMPPDDYRAVSGRHLQAFSPKAARGLNNLSSANKGEVVLELQAVEGSDGTVQTQRQ